MAIELNYKQENINTTNDNIVIRKYIHGLEGGVALDAAGVAAWKAVTGTNVVPAGTAILLKEGKFIPCPLTKGGTAQAPTYAHNVQSGDEIVGVSVASVDATKEGVGVMTFGVVNPAAYEYGENAVPKNAILDTKNVNIAFVAD